MQMTLLNQQWLLRYIRVICASFVGSECKHQNQLCRMYRQRGTEHENRVLNTGASRNRHSVSVNIIPDHNQSSGYDEEAGGTEGSHTAAALRSVFLPSAQKSCCSKIIIEIAKQSR